MNDSDFVLPTPVSAITLADVQIGSKIVSYVPQSRDSLPLIIRNIYEDVEKGEIITLIDYQILGDESGETHTTEPSGLGLSQEHNGAWTRRAIFYDEDE